MEQLNLIADCGDGGGAYLRQTELVQQDKAREDRLIAQAQSIIRQRLSSHGMIVDCPSAMKEYLQVLLGAYQHEVFYCVFLDNRRRVIDGRELFYGTLDGASVYPREVVKHVLEHNAACVIFCHQHPSGLAEPSQADRAITKRLVDALALIDVQVLDHIIVGSECTSFAERGLL